MKKGVAAYFSEERAPYALFLLAAIAHVAVFYALLYFYGPCSFFLSDDCRLNGNDTQHYVIIAENLTHGHGYSRFVDPPYEQDALRTPLLPLYFAPFALAGGYTFIWLAILLLNIILSLAPAVLYKLSRYFLPHAYAIAAGLALVFEPLYLYRSQIAEPDALLVLLLIASIYFLVRSWKEGKQTDIYMAALLMGISILAKPTAQYLIAIMLCFEAAYLVFHSRDAAGEVLKKLGAMIAIIFVIVAPWVVRNKAAFGVAALSSIQGYNLYQYYTVNEKLSDEEIPQYIQDGSREPDRYLPFQGYFMRIALERIKAHPLAYAKEQLVGSIRNLFVSDISQIYYYGHTKLLPFPYDPESTINLHEALLSGGPAGLSRAVFGSQVLPKLLWFAFLAIFYLCAIAGWVYAWTREKMTFLAFTLFFALFAYLLLSSGPFVDAKYRLPAIPLIAIAAMYGLYRFQDRQALRRSAK